jgi:hypothetical protein
MDLCFGKNDSGFSPLSPIRAEWKLSSFKKYRTNAVDKPAQLLYRSEIGVRLFQLDQRQQ